jgi:hypothetical protein
VQELPAVSMAAGPTGHHRPARAMGLTTCAATNEVRRSPLPFALVTLPAANDPAGEVPIVDGGEQRLGREHL